MKIGHISDFHLRSNLEGSSAVPARLSRLMPEKIERALDKLAAEDLDWLAVTGDLVDQKQRRKSGASWVERDSATRRAWRLDVKCEYANFAADDIKWCS